MSSYDKIFTIPNLCLLYQFVGTLLLGWALTTTSIDAITKLASSYWDFSKPVTESLVNQRTDAQFGVAILAFGIILQILENVFSLSEKSHSKCLMILGGGFLAFLLLAYPTSPSACKRKSIISRSEDVFILSTKVTTSGFSVL